LVIPEVSKEAKAIATLHPAYIMRDQTYFPVAVNDLMKGLVPPPEYYTPFPSIDDVRQFKFKQFAFDIETNRWTGEILCVGLCARASFAICVPFRGEYISELKRIFREADVLVGHNCLQFDLPILRDSDV